LKKRSKSIQWPYGLAVYFSAFSKRHTQSGIVIMFPIRMVLGIVSVCSLATACWVYRHGAWVVLPAMLFAMALWATRNKPGFWLLVALGSAPVPAFLLVIVTLLIKGISWGNH
jgi:hypothetical protein